MRTFSFLEKLVKKIAMNNKGINLGGDEGKPLIQSIDSS